MAKVKTAWFCQNCGTQSSKWMGKCGACGEWNTFVEEVVESSPAAAPSMSYGRKNSAVAPVVLSNVEASENQRIVTTDIELNRVLGGGIVPGSLVLLGGEPGIGKSTLMLQIAMQLPSLKILYVSGEESARQIKLRSDRVGGSADHIFIYTETETVTLLKQAEEMKPDILVIDSVQTLYSPLVESGPGSVSQIRQTATECMKFAKENNVPVFLIGHITKDGSIAGPKVLEHLVDTVLQFEGDRHYSYRILRTIKNRFGSTSELGIYEMQGAGLRQVNNPSEILLSQRDSAASGIAIGTTMEGNRPLLIEVQALVSTAAYGTPQRSCTGFDNRRLNMLLAVLEKRAGYRLGQHDVFLNIAGGIKVEDPAIDLAVCAAIASSLHDVAIPFTTCFAGEVGLGGEIRAVHKADQRIAEAEKLGFNEIYLSQASTPEKKNDQQIKLHPSNKIFTVLGDLFS